MRTGTIINSSICLLAAIICSVSGSTDRIYFATSGAGVQSYSLETSTVSTVVDSDVNLESIAYDSFKNKIYYGSYTLGQIQKIYRANADGTEIETLGSNVNFQYVRGLALDGRTGNLYVASSIDGLYVCNTTSSNLTCTLLLTTGDSIYGIALDPIQGEMFISGYSGVYRAQMDGSNLTQIVTGDWYAVGISLDSDSDRLYWASFRNSRIASSFRNGSGLETTVLLEETAYPWGLITLNGSIYYGDLTDLAIHRSSTTAGGDVETVYTGRRGIWQLALVPSSAGLNEFHSSKDAQGNNPCEGQGCSHICALAAKSSRCLCPDGLHLTEDQRTCVG